MKKPVIIETERLLLRPYRKDDEDVMIELLTNSEIKKTFVIPDFKTRSEVVKLFERIVVFSHSDSHFEYGIYLKSEENLIGFVNDCEINAEKGEIELGYVINPDYKGKGYATEVLKASIDTLFEMGYKTVVAGYFAENAASECVMEKCGMVKIPRIEEIEYQGRKHTVYYREIRK